MFFTIALLLASLMIYGQDDGKREEGSLSFNIGYAHLDNADFQQFLASEFSILSEDYVLIGGSGYRMAGDFLIGCSGQFIFGPSDKYGDLKSEIVGGMGFFNLGYAIHNEEQLKIFPMIGIGGGGMNMKITEGGDLNLHEVVNNPKREINLTVGNFLLDFSTGLDFSPFWEISEDGNEGGGLNVGLRAGYLLGFDSDKWSYSGGDVNDVPKFGMRSLYVKLLIGGSGYSIRNSKW